MAHAPTEDPRGAGRAATTAATPDAGTAGAFDSPALQSAPVAIFAVSADGAVCFWNHAAEALFGWSADDVLGHPPPFLADGSMPTTTEVLEALGRGPSTLSGSFALRHRDGRTFEMLATSSLITDDRGDAHAVITLARDVTADQQVVRRLEAAEHKWRQLALRSTDTITLVDRDGHVLQSTGETRATMGYDASWWRNKSGLELIHPDELDDAAETWARLASNPGERIRVVYRTRHRRGHYELIEYTGVNLLDDPLVEGIVLAGRNVSAKKQAELLLADEARVLEMIARDAPLDDVLTEIVRVIDYHTVGTTGVFRWDDDGPGSPLAAGSLEPAAAELVERTSIPRGQTTPDGTHLGPFADAEPVTIVDLATDERAETSARAMLDLGYRACWSVPVREHRTKRLLGFIATFVQQSRAPTAHEQRVQERAGHLAAIAVERARWQRELYQQARFDPLTGLPNRAAIFQTLEEALSTARLQHDTITTMLVDLDRFKVINDSLGHEMGDALIAEFATRLRSVLGGDAFLGRMGADEFVVIFPAGTTTREGSAAAVRVARSLEAPFLMDAEEVFLTCSIGLSTSPVGTERADVLLQQADMAMFRAKDLGRARTVVFDEGLRARTLDRLQVDRDLRLAVERTEFVLYYQPEVDCRTGRIVGTEALLRWDHPHRGIIAPDDFIHAAEDNGAIVPIGYWVLDEAVKQARAWTESIDGLEDFMVNVNLSARQLANRGLVDTVAFVLTRYNWPPSHLTLELTESIVIEDQETTLSVLGRLRQLGVRLAIDDFGTGFASLDYLQRLHVDMVKIDRTFVTPLDADGNGSPVAAAMLSMASAFGLTVCAEGVETADQLAGLRRLGCDLAQGFLMARPLPPDQLEALVRSRPRW